MKTAKIRNSKVSSPAPQLSLEFTLRRRGSALVPNSSGEVGAEDIGADEFGSSKVGFGEIGSFEVCSN